MRCKGGDENESRGGLRGQRRVGEEEARKEGDKDGITGAT